MAHTGSGLGTVVRWDDEQGRGFIELPDLPGQCWIDAAVVHHSTGAGTLRAGQVVEVEWEESADGVLRAVRVAPREDLQTGLGG